MKDLMAIVLIGFSFAGQRDLAKGHGCNYLLAAIPCGESSVQSSKPAYLSQFPSIDQIKAEVRGVDAMETAAKQGGIFWQLRQLIYNLALSQRRTDRQFTPDEQRLEVEYRNAHYKAIEPFEGKVTGADKPKWFELRGKYEMDRWLLDEVMKKYFTPDLRRDVYVALKGQMPTENAPEESRLTAPAGSSTEAANPARTPGSASRAPQSGTAKGRLSYDAAGNWKYQDQWGGVHDKNGYTWADGSLTTNSGYQVKANQPNILDNGDGTKTDLSQALGRPVTLQEARQVAINSEESLQAMGLSQPNTAEAIMAKVENRPSGPGPAVGSDSTASQSGPKTTSKLSQPGPSAGLSAEAYLAEGTRHNDGEDYDRAIEAYKKAIALNPKMSEAYYRLASSYFLLDKDQEALLAIKEAIRLRPNEAAFYLLLGSIHFDLNQKEQALPALQQAVQLKPDFALAHFYLGRTYVRLGRKDDALQVYRKLLTVDKDRAQKLYADINSDTSGNTQSVKTAGGNSPKSNQSQSRSQGGPAIQTKALPPTADAVTQKDWVKAQGGDASAQNSLGRRYEIGSRGLSPDKAEARKWYRLSANQGNASGKANLCNSYAAELNLSDDSDDNPGAPIRALKGSKADIEEAIKWCGASANVGAVLSVSKLVLLYAKGGPGVKPNYEEAYFWLSWLESRDVFRDKVGKKLTVAKRAEIEQRAKAWKPPGR